MKIRLVAAATALSISGMPLSAQPTPVAPALSAPTADRKAAARPVVDQIWPLGTYRRMMDGTMSQMMDSMMQSMLGMRAGDLATGTAPKKGGEVEPTMGEVLAKADPHFRERAKIGMDVMFREMTPIMEKLEP